MVLLQMLSANVIYTHIWNKGFAPRLRFSARKFWKPGWGSHDCSKGKSFWNSLIGARRNKFRRSVPVFLLIAIGNLLLRLRLCLLRKGPYYILIVFIVLYDNIWRRTPFLTIVSRV